MTDKTDYQIAEALCGAGLAWKVDGNYALTEWMPSMYSLPATNFVRDWRTAGACLVEMGAAEIASVCHKVWLAEQIRHGVEVEWLTDPRAICLAYVEARE
jgi:hypothetical protein